MNQWKGDAVHNSMRINGCEWQSNIVAINVNAQIAGETNSWPKLIDQ